MAQKTDLIKKTDKLLADIKKANNDFDKKTSKIVFDSDKIAKDLDKINLDKNLKTTEKNAIEDIDNLIEEYLRETEVKEDD